MKGSSFFGVKFQGSNNFETKMCLLQMGILLDHISKYYFLKEEMAQKEGMYK